MLLHNIELLSGRLHDSYYSVKAVYSSLLLLEFFKSDNTANISTLRHIQRFSVTATFSANDVRLLRSLRESVL